MDAFYRKYFGKIALKSRMTPSSEARGGGIWQGAKTSGYGYLTVHWSNNTRNYAQTGLSGHE